MVTLKPGDALPARFGGLMTVIACEQPRLSAQQSPRDRDHLRRYDPNDAQVWRQRCFCSEPMHDYGVDIVKFVWHDIIVESLNVVASIR